MRELRDTLYETFHTDERCESDFGYLWDTPFFKRCQRGAGYKKYKIQKITYLPDDLEDFQKKIKEANRDYITVLLSIRGTHFKEKSKDEFVNASLEYDETKKKFYIRPRRRFWFTSVLDFFIATERSNLMVHKRQKAIKQYQHELLEIKMKHPEMFL